MKQIKKTLFLVVLLSTIIVLGSCARTEKVEKVQPTGFLEDYGLLYQGSR